MKLQIASSFGPRSGTDVDGPDAIVSSIAFVSIASPAALGSGVRLTADDNSPTVTFARGNVIWLAVCNRLEAYRVTLALKLCNRSLSHVKLRP